MSLGNPENIGDCGQVLGELAVSFFVHSLCDGRVQSLSEDLAEMVCEAGPRWVAALKLC